jgi:NTE family protein
MLAIATLAIVSCAAASAQERPAPGRPKIGLALGGGGPRGFAHIGVLEWLEEHRIPVDYIAGTSMGGIVGAMYATGMTPAEMRAQVQKIDWEEAFRGAPGYDQLTFRRKEDGRRYPSALEFGLRGGLQLPGGLSPAHSIGLMLDRLTLPYSNLDSFDELPIPFRCVATDMLSGDAVVLEKGPLCRALRATMALPGVFTPVEDNGRVLADGGLVNILPADVVRQMGADIVIAVDVGSPLGDREALRSFTGVFNQAIRVMYVQNARRNRALADIVLTPDISLATGADYRKSGVIAGLGYNSAAQQATTLQRRAIDAAAWREHLAQRHTRQQGEGPALEDVQVEGAPERESRAIRERLTKKFVGRPLSMRAWEDDLTGMTGAGRFESFGYERRRIDGKDTMLVRAHPKPYGPPFVNSGLEVSVAKSEEADFTVGARVTALDLGGYGSELRTDVAVGSRPRLVTEYFRPLGRGGWFAAPRLFMGRSSQSLYRGSDRVAEYRRDQAGLGLDIGHALGRRGEVRLGYEISHLNAWVRIGDPLLPAANGTVRAASLRWLFDGQDSASVPTRGARATVAARWFFESPGAAGGFPQLEAHVSTFKPLAPRSSLFAIGGGGTTLGRDAPPQQQFTLGGPLRLGGYGRDEFRGNQYLFLAAGYLHHVASLAPQFGGKVYVGNWLELGSAFDKLNAAKFSGNVSGGVIAETKLGPVFLGGSLGEGGRRKLYFTLGRLF